MTKAKGYGFIACEAFQEDVFLLKSELPQGIYTFQKGFWLEAMALRVAIASSR